MDWIIARAKEPSTWFGIIVTGASLFGISIENTKAMTIAAGVSTLVGVAAVAYKEKK